MEKYYFCNFLDDSLERKVTSGVKKVLIDKDVTENIQLSKAVLMGRDSDLEMYFVGENLDIGGKEFDFIGTFNLEDKKLNKFTYEQFTHTEENPLIVVATDSFGVAEGIPTYIKYMTVNGGVLVALISGCISVRDADGEMLPLSRNCSVPDSDRGKLFKSKDINELNALVDKESDVRFTDYVVNDCIIHIDKSKGKDLASYRFSKEHFSCFYEKVFAEGKLEKEEREKRLLEEAKARRERNAKADAEYQRKEREKELQAERDKMAKKSKVKKNPVKVQTGVDGAASFLAHVENLKRESTK